MPGHGDAGRRLMIVGLAPGMHGANRTGIPFTGDASGDLLYDVLSSLNLADKIYITNAVKCLPIANLPSGREVQNCSPYLAQELHQHAEKKHATLLVLGGVAHRAVIKALGLRQKDFPFGHARTYSIGGLQLVDSFHCSRYNTQTGRLTRQMFLDVMQTAGNMAYP